MRDTMPLEEVQLTNLADGALEREFQTALCEVNSVIANADEYQTNKDGELKLKIDMGAELVWKDGAMTVVVSAKLKRPARRSVARGLYRRGDAWFVWDEGEQMGLQMPRRRDSEATMERAQQGTPTGDAQ